MVPQCGSTGDKGMRLLLHGSQGVTLNDPGISLPTSDDDEEQATLQVCHDFLSCPSIYERLHFCFRVMV